MKLVLFLFFIHQSFGQKLEDEFKKDFKSDYRIDEKYSGGKYLIFNCEKSHFACVDYYSFLNCAEERKQAFNKKSTVLPCAPLLKLEDKTFCIKKNYELVYLNAAKRFCAPK